MLRFCPAKEELIDKVNLLIKENEHGKSVKKNIRKYFGKADAQGPMFVEQENGPDEYIGDLRQDIFERFKKLLGND